MITQYDRDHITDIMEHRIGHDYFTAELLRLCQKADGFNLSLLRVVYPEVVALYEEWLGSPYRSEDSGGTRTPA